MKLSDVIANEVDPYVICAKEAPHVILHPNQAWLEMCGYALEEVEGLTNKILTGPETSDEVIDDLLSCVSHAELSTQTVVNYKKGGQRFMNQVQTMPLFDDEGDLAAFASLLHEIPEEFDDSLLNPADAHLWSALTDRLPSSPLSSSGFSGAAAKHAPAACEEAARKLLSNHNDVLADATNDEPIPLSQPELKRIDYIVRPYADQALRTCARRLMGGAARGTLEERLVDDHPALGAQQQAWLEMVSFLDARIQTERHPSGRAPDMSVGAAAALRAVLREMAKEAMPVCRAY